MFWLIGIAGVWSFCCLIAVALCVAAGRGDQRLSLMLASLPDAPTDVDFVLTFAATESAPAVPAPRVSVYSRRHQLDDLELQQRGAVGDRALGVLGRLRVAARER